MEVDDGFAAGGGQEEGAFFLVVQVEVEGDGCGDVGVFQEILGHLNWRKVCGVNWCKARGIFRGFARFFFTPTLKVQMWYKYTKRKDKKQ